MEEAEFIFLATVTGLNPLRVASMPEFRPGGLAIQHEMEQSITATAAKVSDFPLDYLNIHRQMLAIQIRRDIIDEMERR